MNRLFRFSALLVLLVAALPARAQGRPETVWRFRADSEALVKEGQLRAEIIEALEAAEKAGTDPSLSHFRVRAATVVETSGGRHTVLGGNTEYCLPEAIHGESSLLNHVTALYGPEVTRHAVRFVAFYSERCGSGASCGDCRDYQKATTDWSSLLVVCGQGSDHTIRVTRFRDQLVDEERFPAVAPGSLPLSSDELARLEQAAEQAWQGGVTLFTTSRHSAAAALSYNGRVYRASGADDAAFHYRYPIGGLLQQAATDRDYLLRAILVVGEKGRWPEVSYRDRQYGFESSSFNREAGKPPIALILADGKGNYRGTTFELALPQAFSTADFMPGALKEFLRTHGGGAAK